MKPNKKMRAAIALGKQLAESKPKERKCYACNGSGHYDTNGSPKCGACGGTGKGRHEDR